MSTFKRVSMREIAEAAGVSVMTVSLALRNRPHVASATREKVMKIAQSMGYQPDPALSALIAYRSAKTPAKFHGTITYINYTHSATIHKRNKLHKDYYEGAQERAGELGFQLDTFWLAEPGMSPQRASQILSYKQVSGLLIGPMSEPHLSLKLDWDRFTSISFGVSMETPRLSSVCAHNFQCVSLAVESMVKRGYRRIGMVITESQDERKMRAWSGAFLGQQNALLLKKNHIPILSIQARDRASFVRWFKQHQPDALLLGYIDVIGMLEKLGVRIGEDLGVALAFREFRHPEFAHVNHNNFLVGRTAVDVLSGLIYRNERGVPLHPVETMIDGEWHDGFSLPDISQPGVADTKTSR